MSRDSEMQYRLAQLEAIDCRSGTDSIREALARAEGTFRRAAAEGVEGTDNLRGYNRRIDAALRNRWR